MEALYDMHCHLGFAANEREVADQLARDGAFGALSCTVAPEEYEAQRLLLAGCAEVRVGLGLHPWWVADGRCGQEAVERFCELAPAARFIGEVGLELSGRYASSGEAQVSALRRALAACNEGDAGKVVSVHAVGATDELLDELERAGTLERHHVVFHWFSDTPEGLKRAVASGCSFSVGTYMLETRRGREYARIIPERCLLLETDSPSRAGKLWSAAMGRAQLEEGLHALALLRDADEGQLEASIAVRSRALLGLTGAKGK